MVFSLLALSLFVLPQRAGAEEQEKLKIGFGGALLGNLASYGLSNFYGLEYATLAANAQGGVLGRQLELISQDDSCNPSQAVAAATKLVSDGIKLIFGHTCSGATRSALSVYEDKALLISSSATENSLTDSGNNPFFFRTTPRDDAQASLLVAMIKKNGYKKIAILHDKGDYGKSIAEIVNKLLESQPGLGAQVVLFEGITSGQVSFDSVISKIKNAEAEAIIWGGYYNDAAKLIIQTRQKRVGVTLLGPDGLYDQRFIALAQESAEGTYCAGQVDLSRSEAAQVAVADHQKRYYGKDIGPYFLYAAGAAQALFAAVSKVGSDTDLAAIKKRLHEDTVETVMGPVRFNAKGDIIGASFKLFVVKNGQYVEAPL
jgi:branched-chain amino acid transport system substrate-binding protein